MAVWANTRAADETGVRCRLRDAKIERYFSSVITSVDAGFRKPAPEFFQLALANWNFVKADILFVCNQINTDVFGAEQYGIRTAWLSGPEFRSDDETMTLADAQPSFIISDLTQLPSLLQTIAVRASSSA
jgi:putative hydrolase of the HAD superfamily